MTPPDPALARIDDVVLTMPARPTYARVVRLAATGLAARLGYGYDDVEDLRIGVGEMCNLLCDGAGRVVRMRFTLTADRIDIDAVLIGRESDLTPGPLSWQILRAVLSDLAVDPAAPRIRATKHRSVAP